MSCSSLWGMNKEFLGEELIEFRNSWLFSPIVWNVLFEKYLPEEVEGRFGKQSYMGAATIDNTMDGRLNDKINNSSVVQDRILWEMSQQQVFFTKDKELVVQAVNHFLEINKSFTEDIGSHIHDRFHEVALEISELDEKEYPYFIFKNTSVDDNVEYWFRKLDEEEEEYIPQSLKEVDKPVTEFVLIEGQIITGFIDNIDFMIEVK